MYFIFKRIQLFFIREKLFTLLVVIYVTLLVIDNNLLFKTIHYINIDTLSLIVSLLLVSRGLEFSGFFSRVSKWILEKSTGSVIKLYLLVIVFSALSSTIIMNDTSLFIFIPFIMTLSRYLGRLDYLLVLTTISANMGSSLTPIGNPQNIIIWQYYKLDFIDFVYAMVPFLLIGITILIIYLFVGVKKFIGYKQCGRTLVPRIRLNKKLFVTSIILLTLNVLLAQLGLQVYGLVVTVVIYGILEKTLVLGLDYVLIFIFAFMFIDFNELSHIIDTLNMIPQLKTSFHVILLSCLLSQVISNVPTTITLVGHIPSPLWKALALGVNLGGVGFIVGSMANIIALRMSYLNLKTFHKYALPYFAIMFTIILLLAYHNIYP